MALDRNTASFLVLCLIWGTTWIGIKAGITTVPPLMFAGTRFTAAGTLILVATFVGKPLPHIRARDWPQLAGVSMLMIPLCYGPLFWGMLYIDSGTAAVLEMSLTPIALLGFALLLRQEVFDKRRLVAIVLGVAGLITLFGPDAFATVEEPGNADPYLRMFGAFAVASAAFTYALGSVLARPLLAIYPANLIAGMTTLIGGIALIAASLVAEPGAVQALSGQWGWAAWTGWLFLVLFGSLIGYTLYMRLLRDIGASRAGSYAFVSPIVAVLLGVIFFQETVHILDVVGMIVMLFGAYLAMTKASPAVIGDASSRGKQGVSTTAEPVS